MSLKEHAKLELEMAGYLDKDSDYEGMIGDAVMELMEVFSKQGHSGASAPIVARLFNKLANYEPLQPITGKDEEWGEPDDWGQGPIWQNKRMGSIFKHEDGTVTYNSAIIKRCPNGFTWSGPLYLTREDAINSDNKFRVKLKGFPFTPKTFYIDVIEEEIEKDDWIMWVKDPKQLDEVLEYYDRY